MTDRQAGTRFRAAACVVLLAMAAGASVSTAETVTCTGVVTDNTLEHPPQPRARLGWSVDFDDTWLVGGAPGAPLNENQGNLDGAVALYKNPRSGVPPTLRIASAHSGDRFGFSVSIDGDWLAVGAPLGGVSGVVYLYKKTGGTFTTISSATLAPSNADRGTRFGFSVALRGNFLVVGAPYDSDRGNQAGSIYVFQYSDETRTWGQTVELHAEDARPFDLFGSAVAIDAGTIVVGAPFADDLTRFRNFGAAYVFENSTDWNQTRKLTAGDFRYNILFGASVAIRGDWIVVGAPGDDVSGEDSGSAYIFERGSWSRHELRPATPGEPGVRGQFGTSVDIDIGEAPNDLDNRVLVGAPFTGPSGRTYLFKMSEDSTWTENQKFVHTERGAFGQSVAIHGNDVFPGGYLYDAGSAINAGAIAVCPTNGTDTVKLECKQEQTDPPPPSVVAGENVTYTISVSNQGSVPATGVKLTNEIPELTNEIPADLVFDSSSCDGHTGPIGPAAPPDPLCDLGTIRKGDDPKKVTVTFQVPAIPACRAVPDIENKAKVSAAGGFSAECTATTSILVPTEGKLVCEQSGPATATTGDLITYRVKVSNQGCKEVRNVVLKDPTPDGLEFVDIGPCSKLPCKLGTIRPGPPVNVDVKFRVQQCRSSVENIVSVSGSGGTKDTCRFTTDLEGADLVVDLRGAEIPAVVSGGQVFDIPVSVSNLGPRKATNVTVRVDIPGAASVTVIPADAECTEGPPGRFLCTFEEIACGDSELLTFRVEAPDCPACSCGVPPGPIRVTAVVLSGVTDPDGSNNSDSAEVRVDCPPDVCLAIKKEGSPNPVALGEKVTYTITVENKSCIAADGVRVEDSPPAGLTGVEWCQGSPTCEPSLLPPIVADIVMPPSSTEVFRVRGTASQCGPLLNTASAAHADETVMAEATTQVEGLALLCTQIDGASLEGSMITYTFKLINCGPDILMDDPGDEFTDTLPIASLTLVSASADSGTTGTSGNTATWNGSLGVGETVTIKIKATINPLTAGMVICNQATGPDGILSDDPDMPGDADPCCFQVIDIDDPNIPTLSSEAALVLILLLAALTLRRLRSAR